MRADGDDPGDRDKTNGSEKKEREKLLEKCEGGQQIDKGWKERTVAQEETHVLGERGSKNPRLFLMQVISHFAHTTGLWDNSGQEL